MRAFVACLLAAAAVATPAAAAPITAPIDRVTRIALPGAANTVVLGNPAIADVIVHDGSTLFVTGKAVGTTNLIVLDAEGRVILSSPIDVNYAAHGRLVFNRGSSRQSYACAGSCEPIPTPGDAAEATQALVDSRRALIAAAREEAQAE